MLYTYDERKLNFYLLSTRKIIIFLLIIASLISFTSLIIGKYLGKKESYSQITEMERMVLIKDADPFSRDKFVEMLKELNVKYPHIVMAQSMIETGQWKSKIFVENNNLFGMKEAKMRITTAGGTQYNHAFYNHWRESIYDYAFYQCRYLGHVNSEGEYFQYLAANYAESPNYLNAIKDVIEKEDLKALF
jgi:flagellum-specific peptidoglycan hydrolase FlgJ